METDMQSTLGPHREHPTDGQVAAAISTAVVHALGEYTGRGPTKARTYVNRDVITVLRETRSPRPSAGSSPTATRRPCFKRAKSSSR